MKNEKFSLSTWAVEHQQLVSFIMLLIVSIGYVCYQNLPREEDPGFTIKTAVVSTEWPGTSPEDMVVQVTDKIEKEIQELPYIDSVESQTKKGYTEITVNLLDETPPEKVKPTWVLLRSKMHDLSTQLPNGTSEILVNDEYDATYGSIIGLTGEGYGLDEMTNKAKDIQKSIMMVPGVGKTLLLGSQKSQVVLRYSPQKLASMGLTPEDLSNALHAQYKVIDTGEIRTRNDIIDISLQNSALTLNDLRHKVLTFGSTIVPLTSIVNIETCSTSQPTPIFHVNGKPAIGIGVSMASGGNMLDFGSKISKIIEKESGNLPVGMELHIVADQSIVVQNAVSGFIHVLIEAIVIVLAISFVSLGLRAGLVVATAIPIVLAMTFIGVYFAGIGLQRISLGALIIALGLLVDDAMITIESIVSDIDRGEPLIKAATNAFRKTSFPMLTGTIVMICGFIPVGFAKSAAGEYCYSLFIVITISLLSSWVVAVLFSPLTAVWIMPKKLHHCDRPQSRYINIYSSLINILLKKRLYVIFTSIALLLTSFWASQWMRSEFFPSSDRPELLVSFILPESSTQEKTDSVVNSFERNIKSYKDISSFSSYIGTGAIRFYMPLDVQTQSENRAQVVIVSKGFKEREALQVKLNNLLSSNYSSYVTRVTPLELGPPVGWPIKYRIEGRDSTKVNDISRDLMQQLSKHRLLTNINLTSGGTERVIKVNINKSEAQVNNISEDQIAQALRDYYSGILITKINDDKDHLNVLLSPERDIQQNFVNLPSLLIKNNDGINIPLSQISNIEWGIDYPLIERRNRLAFNELQADVIPGKNSDDVSDYFSKTIAKINENLPNGYHIYDGGESEDSDKGNSSLFEILPITLIFIFSVMMVQLQSYSRTILAAIMVPFGFVGITAIMVPTRVPVGFVAILGMIALSGMIMRNAIIMISEVDNNLKLKMSTHNSIKYAALNRLRPITLTACAAIFGMIPITQQVFWGPMACVVIGGLISGTIFTLTLLPVLLSYLLEWERKVKY